ncbi:MAG: hypothetical protein PF442_04810 [Desulfobulbaceae bacterium]|jgi:hypothetical protein|nr:hypothetical protein [Desulfobulbaceae bacterium]
MSNIFYGLTQEVPTSKYGRNEDKDNRKKAVIPQVGWTTFFLHLRTLTLYYWLWTDDQELFRQGASASVIAVLSGKHGKR